MDSLGEVLGGCHGRLGKNEETQSGLGETGAERVFNHYSTIPSRVWNRIQHSQVSTFLCCQQVYVKPTGRVCILFLSSGWSHIQDDYLLLLSVSSNGESLCCQFKSSNPVDGPSECQHERNICNFTLVYYKKKKQRKLYTQTTLKNTKNAKLSTQNLGNTGMKSACGTLIHLLCVYAL